MKREALIKFISKHISPHFNTSDLEKRVELVLEAVQTYFPSLFHLNTLDILSKQLSFSSGKVDIAALQLLIDCTMHVIESLGSPEMIANGIHQFLNSNTAKDSIFTLQIDWEIAGKESLVPSANQLGTIEKLLTVKVERVPPLTHLDMLRCLFNFKYHQSTPGLLEICNIHTYPVIDKPGKKTDNNVVVDKRLLLMDVNDPNEQIPMWVLFDENENKVEAFERLTPKHKRKINELLNSPTIVDSDNHSAATSGYYLLKKLNDLLKLPFIHEEKDFFEFSAEIFNLFLRQEDPKFNFKANEIELKALPPVLWMLFGLVDKLGKLNRGNNGELNLSFLRLFSFAKLGGVNYFGKATDYAPKNFNSLLSFLTTYEFDWREIASLLASARKNNLHGVEELLALIPDIVKMVKNQNELTLSIPYFSETQTETILKHAKQVKNEGALIRLSSIGYVLKIHPSEIKKADEPFVDQQLIKQYENVDDNDTLLFLCLLDEKLHVKSLEKMEKISFVRTENVDDCFKNEPKLKEVVCTAIKEDKLPPADKINKIFDCLKRKGFYPVSYSSFNQINFNAPPRVEDLTAAFIFYVLRNYARVPHVALMADERIILSEYDEKLIFGLINNNPYIKKLELVGRAFQEVANLAHFVVTRNNWLEKNNYYPVEGSDLWQEASYYTFKYLYKHRQSNLLLAEHSDFTQMMTQMGSYGLRAFLNYVHSQKENLSSNILENNHLPFFIANVKFDVEYYYKSLNQFINNTANYFPFSRIVIRLSSDNENKLPDLLTNLNQRLSQLESKKTVLTKSIPFEDVVISIEDGISHLQAVENFLKSLCEAAKKENWLTLIRIPHLDQDELNPTYKNIRQLYYSLNNVILINKRRKLELESPESKQALTFSKKQTVKESKQEVEFAPIAAPIPLKREKETTEEKIWFLDKKLGASLETQLAMQLHTQAESQLHLATMETFALSNEPLPNDLITYSNINQYAHRFQALAEKKVQSLPDKQLIAGNVDKTASLLQQFFATWIGANPAVIAPYIIYEMSIETVEYLLQHAEHFVQGIDIDNLPKELHLCRDEENRLVMLHDINKPAVPLLKTFQIDVNDQPKACEKWLGDFRQFSSQPYVESNNNNNKSPEQLQDILPLMITFTVLQPEEGISALKDKFRELFTEQEISDQQEFFDIFWHVLFQIHQYYDMEFAKKCLADEELRELFINSTRNPLSYILPKDSEVWTHSEEEYEYLNLTTANSVAIGQIYYKLGAKAVERFLLKLVTCHQQFSSEEDYLHFKEYFIDNVHNGLYWYNDRFFNSLDQLALLSATSNAEEKEWMAIWKIIVTYHMRSMPYAALATLWGAYSEFKKYLKQNELILHKECLAEDQIHHIQTYFYRLLYCLERLTNNHRKQLFLNHLTTFDLSSGGVPYAICYDGFQILSADLQLSKFSYGEPTYQPSLANIEQWNEQEFSVKSKRLLAIKLDCEIEQYNQINKILEESPAIAKQLLIIISTVYVPLELRQEFPTFLQKAKSFDKEFLQLIGDALKQLPEPVITRKWIDFPTLQLLHFCYTETSPGYLKKEFFSEENGIFFEIVSIISKKQCSLESKFLILKLFIDQRWQLLSSIPLSVCKVLILFSNFSDLEVKQLNAIKLACFSYQDNKLLNTAIEELLSYVNLIDWERTKLSAQFSHSLQETFGYVLNSLPGSSTYYLTLQEFLKQLKDKAGLVLIGHAAKEDMPYRNVSENELPATIFAGLGDETVSVKKLICKHIAIKVGDDIERTLVPFVNLLKKLKHRKSYIEELPFLLNLLTIQNSNAYWCVEDLISILTILMPTDTSQFPFSLLEVLLKAPTDNGLKAVNLEEVKINFANKAQTIRAIATSSFSRKQKKLLLEFFCFAPYDKSAILFKLQTCLTNMPSFVVEAALLCYQKLNNLDVIESLIQIVSTQGENNFASAIATWLEAIQDKKYFNLWEKLNQEFDPERLPYVLHLFTIILLNNQLSKNIKDELSHDKKLNKMVQYLKGMKKEQLITLTSIEKISPRPNLADLSRALKRWEGPSQPVEDILQLIETSLHKVGRMDHGYLSETRKVDLNRILSDITYTSGGEKKKISNELRLYLLSLVMQLKNYESGVNKLDTSGKAISEFSTAELQKAIQARANKTDQQTEIELLALLFEAMYRTNHKYVHLAQQVASILKAFVSTNHQIELDMGEGKSLLIMIRMARLALLGDYNTLATMKENLAYRDYVEFKPFFDFIGVKTHYLTLDSDFETVIKSQIIFTTFGTYSRVNDRFQHAGKFIADSIPHQKRTLHCDESDFIFFTEAEQMQYNLAANRLFSFKEASWFYTALVEFYKKNKKAIEEINGVTSGQIEQFKMMLDSLIKDNEERQLFLRNVIGDFDDAKIVKYIISASTAFGQVQNRNYLISPSRIVLGEEEYALYEIIPLSRDNQLCFGSTYSRGVHQLLVTQHNMESKNDKKYYAPDECPVISSKMPLEVAGFWNKKECYTATSTDRQAKQMYQRFEVECIEIPSNQPSLRIVHPTRLCKNKEEHLSALEETIQNALANKKSILVICEDDNSVDTLRILGKKNEKWRTLYHTNQSTQTVSQLLKDKKELEEWKNHQKTNGVVLFSSSLSRGDNVDVEVVIDFRNLPLDSNNQKQGGGRTGRNGAEGDVYSFYLRHEIEAQLKKFHYEIKGNEDDKTLTDMFQRLQAENEEKENAATLLFNEIMSHYCSWTFQIFKHTDAEQKKESLTKRLATSLSAIHTEWFEKKTSSAKDLSGDPKQLIDLILPIFKEAAVDLKKSVALILADDHLLNDFEFKLSDEKKQPAISPLAVEINKEDLFHFIIRNIKGAPSNASDNLKNELDKLSVEKKNLFYDEMYRAILNGQPLLYYNVLRRVKNLALPNFAASPTLQDNKIIEEDHHFQVWLAKLPDDWQASYKTAYFALKSESKYDELFAVRLACPKPLALSNFRKLFSINLILSSTDEIETIKSTLLQVQEVFSKKSLYFNYFELAQKISYEMQDPSFLSVIFKTLQQISLPHEFLVEQLLKKSYALFGHIAYMSDSNTLVPTLCEIWKALSEKICFLTEDSIRLLEYLVTRQNKDWSMYLPILLNNSPEYLNEWALEIHKIVSDETIKQKEALEKIKHVISQPIKKVVPLFPPQPSSSGMEKFAFKTDSKNLFMQGESSSTVEKAVTTPPPTKQSGSSSSPTPPPVPKKATITPKPTLSLFGNLKILQKISSSEKKDDEKKKPNNNNK